MPAIKLRSLQFPANDTAWLLAGLAVVALLGLPSLTYPFGRDQAMFAYIGDQWRHGAVPYRDTWDIKPPGVFWVYALAIECFGRNMAAARWADWIAALLTAGGIYAIVRRTNSAAHAGLAMFLSGSLYYVSFGYWDTAQAESFAAPAAVLMIYSMLRGADTGRTRWWAAAGFCLGTLLLLKTVFLLYALLPCAVCVPGRSTVRRASLASGLFAFAFTALIVPGICVLYFAAHRALPEFAELFAAQAGYARGQHAGLWLRFCTVACALFTQPVIVICGSAMVWALFSPNARCRDFRVLLAWFACSVALALVQGRLYYYHWVPSLPPLAVIASSALHVAWRSVRRQRSFLFRTTGAAAWIMALLLPVALYLPRVHVTWLAVTGRLGPAEYYRQFRGPAAYSILDNLRAANYISRRSLPGETVLVMAFEPAIYFLADRSSASRRLSLAPLVGETQIPFALRSRWLAQQTEDASARPPRFLVVTEGVHRDGLVFTDPNRLTFAGHRYAIAHVEGMFRLYRRLNQTSRTRMESLRQAPR